MVENEKVFLLVRLITQRFSRVYRRLTATQRSDLRYFKVRLWILATTRSHWTPVSVSEP